MNHEVTINKQEWEKYLEEKIIRIENLPEQYQVKCQYYKCNIPGKHYWNQLELNVYKNNELVVTVGRNYHSPAHSVYATQNGQEFIITSGDYMCITIINLTKGTAESYTWEERYTEGGAYCPISFKEWDEEESELSFIGCVWACPDEIVTFEDVNLDNPIFDWVNAHYEYRSVEDDYYEDDEEENPY